jgi:GDP/UDP-N,N'-diacetylbacillosamine 2-epimerase (hydrolysing)
MQTDSFFIFTKANADTNGRIINQMMEAYVKKNPEKSALFASLGSLRYLSVMKQVTAVVGNSSSGILEAPSANTATINIGDRQKGRIQAESIVNCSTQKEDILQAFQKIQSEEFRNKLNDIINPYGNGNASHQIIDIFKSMSVDKLSQKSFYDIQQ